MVASETRQLLNNLGSRIVFHPFSRHESGPDRCCSVCDGFDGCIKCVHMQLLISRWKLGDWSKHVFRDREPRDVHRVELVLDTRVVTATKHRYDDEQIHATGIEPSISRLFLNGYELIIRERRPRHNGLRSVRKPDPDEDGEDPDLETHSQCSGCSRCSMYERREDPECYNELSCWLCSEDSPCEEHPDRRREIRVAEGNLRAIFRIMPLCKLRTTHWGTHSFLELVSLSGLFALRRLVRARRKAKARSVIARWLTCKVLGNRTAPSAGAT